MTYPKIKSKHKKLLTNPVPGYEDICHVDNCSTPHYAMTHEIFFGKNSQLSKEYGLQVKLCWQHHQSNEGVHHNITFDNHLKRIGQQYAMDKYNWTEDDFRKIFGKSYLEVES